MDKLTTLLTRGVERIYPSKEALEKVLKSGKKLRVYQGFDPTSTQLHIGHMIGLRKLRQWQDLGHEVIFLIGDFTGMIGDPSGKDKSRVPLTHEQVLKNAENYKKQSGKILRFSGENPVLIKYNSEWLNKLTVPEISKLLSYLTYQQVIERDMFQKRIQNNMDIFVNELFYPILQGYDSVAMDVDVEVGGNDQLFNMMTGRDLMHKIKRKNKFVMTTPLLVDSSGKKVGKTEGNAIALLDKPNDLYGKIMALGDDVIVKALEYLTDIRMEEVLQIEKKIKNGENPMPYKKQLAFEMVKFLNTEAKAEEAQAFFEQIHQKKKTDLSENIPMINGQGKSIREIIINNLKISASEFKRLIAQKAVDINNNTVTDAKIQLQSGDIVKVGKHHIYKIK